MSILSALIGVWLTDGDNNIFTQIGLMVLVGLSAKNAILIVEFARELEMQGRSIVQAAIEASRLRLRPILMTSIAFIMGVVPLVLSSGAGSEMRHAMGIAVFFGMLGVTLVRPDADAGVLCAAEKAGGRRTTRRQARSPTAHERCQCFG